MGKVGIFNFIAIVLSFLFVDLFDTLGTLVGVSTKAGMLDEEDKLPGIKPALMADAVATTAGAVLGTSTVTTFVESSSGVAAGGRTGLTAVVSGFLFLISTLFYSISIGIISYVILNVVCGKAKKITPLMYVLAVLFILKYAVL